MTSKKHAVKQKAHYWVLFVPLLFLLYSVWAVMRDIQDRSGYAGMPAVVVPASSAHLLSGLVFAIGTLWVLIDVIYKFKRRILVSVERKGILVCFLGGTLAAFGEYFPGWHFLAYKGIALADIAVTMVIVTLLQGKPFGPFKLYQKDVQVDKGT